MRMIVYDMSPKELKKLEEQNNYEQNCIVRINIKEFKKLQDYESDGREHAIYGIYSSRLFHTDESGREYCMIVIAPLNFILDKDMILSEHMISSIKNKKELFFTRISLTTKHELLSDRTHWFL